MAVIRLNGIDIPNVKGGETQGFEEFADFGMTAGGLRRKDVLAIKRTWSYETNPLTKSDAESIINSMRTVSFRDVPFANDFDNNFASPIQVYVTLSRTRARGTINNVFSNELQILKIDIKER